MNEQELGKINKNIPIPLYYQISDLLLRKIASKDLLPNQQIPSEKELASAFDVNRMTVRQAIIKLVNEGVVFRRRGHGTFVSEPKIERVVARLLNFNTDMRESGLEPSSVVLQKKIIQAPDEVRDLLKLKKGETLVKVIRLRLANDKPIAISKSMVPTSVCPKMAEENLDNVESLTRFLEEKGDCKIAYAKQKIQAVDADSYRAKLLEIKKGSPLLHLSRIFYTNEHYPLGVFDSFYRGDRYMFTETLYR